MYMRSLAVFLLDQTVTKNITGSRSTFDFRAGSTFPVPVCTVSPVHWINKADTQ